MIYKGLFPDSDNCYLNWRDANSEAYLKTNLGSFGITEVYAWVWERQYW